MSKRTQKQKGRGVRNYCRDNAVLEPGEQSFEEDSISLSESTEKFDLEIKAIQRQKGSAYFTCKADLQLGRRYFAIVAGRITSVGERETLEGISSSENS